MTHVNILCNICMQHGWNAHSVTVAYLNTNYTELYINRFKFNEPQINHFQFNEAQLPVISAISSPCSSKVGS
jgi:hypothetical protein